MNRDVVVVMFTGPHYGGTIHFGRIDKAIDAAKKRHCPLMICGDGNRGFDLEVFRERARARGLRQIILSYDKRANTRGDAAGAAKKISCMPGVHDVLVVTDWYHMLRACEALRMELETQESIPGVTSIHTHSVFQHFIEGCLRLPGELRGFYDYRLKRTQRSWGSHGSRGKPAFQNQKDHA